MGVGEGKREQTPNHLDRILFQGKIHTINAVGEIVRVEIFNGELKNQISGLLLNTLTRQTERFVHLTVIDGYGVNRLKIPIRNFENTRISQWRSLIEPNQMFQFLPVDANRRLTLIPEKIKKIIQVEEEEFQEILGKFQI